MKLIRIPKTKKTYLDVVKLLAILMVVFNHTGNAGYMRYVEVSAQPANMLLMCFSALIKAAVPLFFMASGALLLGKDEPYGAILCKRVVRFVLVLLAVSLYYYVDSYGWQGAASVKDFLLHVYRNSLKTHMWYLYSYISYMLMLPFLRKLARGMGDKEFLLLVCFALIAELIPVADYALFRGTAAHTYHLSFFIENKYVVYPLLGYYIENMPKERKREETPYVLMVLCALALMGTVSLMRWRCAVDGGWTVANGEAYMDKLVIVPTVAIFYLCKRLFDGIRLKGKTADVLFVLGSCTFGVYLFDPLWREMTSAIRTLLTPLLGTYFATHVQVLCACVLGMAATLVYKCAIGGLKAVAKAIWKDPDKAESKQPAAQDS